MSERKPTAYLLNDVLAALLERDHEARITATETLLERINGDEKLIAALRLERDAAREELARVKAERDRLERANAAAIGEAARQVENSDRCYRQACEERNKLRRTVELLTMLCHESGEPCDGFRFRELIRELRQAVGIPKEGQTLQAYGERRRPAPFAPGDAVIVRNCFRSNRPASNGRKGTVAEVGKTGSGVPLVDVEFEGGERVMFYATELARTATASPEPPKA